jgi:hypothetical protein
MKRKASASFVFLSVSPVSPVCFCFRLKGTRPLFTSTYRRTSDLLSRSWVRAQRQTRHTGLGTTPKTVENGSDDTLGTVWPGSTNCPHPRILPHKTPVPWATDCPPAKAIPFMGPDGLRTSVACSISRRRVLKDYGLIKNVRNIRRKGSIQTATLELLRQLTVDTKELGISPLLAQMKPGPTQYPVHRPGRPLRHDVSGLRPGLPTMPACSPRSS